MDTYSQFSGKNIIYSHKQFPEGIPTKVEPHSHEICELIFWEDGEADYLVEGKEYKLSKYSLIITRPGDRHRIRFRKKGNYKRYDILVEEKKLFRNINHIISRDIDVINFSGNRIVIQLFQKMDFYCEHFEGDELEKILINLINEVFYNVHISAEVDTCKENPILKKALEYIQENLTTHIDIEALCHELYISKSYLHKLFVKYLRISPKKYIVSKRLIMAQRAIRAGEKPTIIYSDCGFSDYSSFWRDYKKYFGIAPSEEQNRSITHVIRS